MTVDSKGHGLFIVDNSVSGWTGLRYLEEWSSIAKAFDIATGYFEIGALLTLDGKWQGLDKVRILMGAETTHWTRKAILGAVRAQALDRLDESIEEDKEPNPFLHGVPGILDALRSGQIECRVYDKDKFHAKAYITHAKLEVVGAQALVGSSNFTRPGLTKNIELNVQIQSAREVAQLQEWFETHWNEASEVTEAVIETISRHTHLYSPFDVYAKALQQFFRGHDLTATEWEKTRSRMFPHLDRYQQEAYWALMKIARQHGGAFLCDGVGLGKTHVGLMLIERLILHEGKRVALFAPKATKEGVWEPHLRRWLSHIGGVGGGADFSNLAVFSHTDLGRMGDFPERFKRIAELADVVVIDEAHHFRNPGRWGDPDRGIEPSRYYRLFELLDNAERPKTVFMLTATPINNRLSDFRHMTELFTRRDEAYFARTIGVNNLRAHFNQMEKTLRSRVGQDEADAAEHMTEAQEILFNDAFFRELVVQRSPRLRPREPDPGVRQSSRLSRAEGPSRSGVLDPQNLRADARPVREGLREAEPALHAADVLPPALVQGGRTRTSTRSRRTARDRWSASSGPTSSSASRARSPPSSSPATDSSRNCSPSSRFTARATPRRSALSAGRRRTPMSWATPSSGSSSSGAKRARRRTTKTSSPRKCSTRSSASTGPSTTWRR